MSERPSGATPPESTRDDVGPGWAGGGAYDTDPERADRERLERDRPPHHDRDGGAAG